MQTLLGIQAPNLAVISLVTSLAVMLLLTVGAALAHMKRYTAHKWVQTTGVALNVILVLTVMVESFAKAVVPGLPRQIAQAYYAVAVVHGLIGLLAVGLGVFVVLRGHGLVPRALRFKNYKLFMRTGYAFYLGATVLGAWVFATWYGGTTPVAALASTANTGERIVPMTNFSFSPNELVVPQGATVVWVNQDRVPHNVVADDGRAFRSELFTSGQHFQTTFSQLGTFPYYCELHGGAGGVDMAGVIRVVAAQDAPALAAAPAPIIQPTAPDALAAAPALPTQARSFVAQLLDDGPGLPTRQGYVAGLAQQADELARHAAFVAHAQQTGDLAGLRRHAEHVYNLIAGSLDNTFGDLDHDGHAQNPGDGFGLLTNGSQAGYLQASAATARAAATAPDATDAIKLHAGHVQVCVENMRGWAEEARAIAQRLTRVASAAEAAGDTAQLLQLSEQIAQGVDRNGDGEVAPIAGEGGALVAYQHARFMAGLNGTSQVTP